ncbi:MAG TPA: hypothetical protein VM260_09070 [Pirellula sp.]|nr:hypothetical protein [Pirellula sp.]
MTRKFMWVGFFVGSSIGNLLPITWGGDAMSVAGFVLSMVGGIAGMYFGRRVAQSL